MNNEKLDELLQLSKLTEFIKEKRQDEKVRKAAKVVLICVGAATLIGIGCYIAYRLLSRYNDDYDLYDDLDNYYEEEPEDFAEDAVDDAEDFVEEITD